MMDDEHMLLLLFYFEIFFFYFRYFEAKTGHLFDLDFNHWNILEKFTIDETIPPKLQLVY